MVTGILAVLGIGGLLGFRHAFEPDHLAAVSTLASRPGPRSLWSVARLGLAWGVGHSVTVGAIALLVVVLGVRLPASLWPTAELAVAGLLVLLGGSVVWRYARGHWHMHMHSHQPSADSHLHLHSHERDAGHAHGHGRADARRSLGFGVAHGLAGSGAIAVLLVAAAPTAGLRTASFAAFGAGTILGMLAVTITLGALVRLASERGARVATLLHVGSASLSVLVGIALAQRVLFGG